ncbi:hypothetical protein Tco_0465971 [Tanacetum coccineum]
MSNHEQPTPSHPKSDVRNTAGKNKQTPQGSVRTTSAVDLEEFCEKHYEKLLPIMVDKYEYEIIWSDKVYPSDHNLQYTAPFLSLVRMHNSTYFRSLVPYRSTQPPQPSPLSNTNVLKSTRVTTMFPGESATHLDR